MSDIKFTPAEDHGEPHPDYPDSFYLDLATDGGYANVHGYVSRDVLKLIEAAPELLHALRTLLVAVQPAPTLPEWQDRAYLHGVAIPRAQAVFDKVTKP